MIVLDRVSHVAGVGNQTRKMLSSVALDIPTDRHVALLATLDEDKRIFIDLLAGLVLPSAGRIVRKARVSFPVGYLGGFLRDLPVRLNVAHVARLYGLDVDRTIDLVKRSLTIGEAFERPYKELPRNLIAPLGHAVSYAIPFDVYLHHREVTRLWKGATDTLLSLVAERTSSSGAIVAVRNERFACKFCDLALILHQGQAVLTDKVEQAFAIVENLRSETPAVDRSAFRAPK